MKPEILIVEDDVITSESIACDLEKENYRVIDQCVSGEDALKLISDKLPDLVIMDIELKGDLNGIQVAEKISKNFNIPIIYLTDAIDDGVFQKAKRTLPSSYLTKPFQTHQLLKAMELALFKGTAPSQNSEFGFFKTPNKEAVKVYYRDILYLNSDKVYCHMTLKGRQIMISQPMKAVLKRIPYKDLVRISKTHCVNRNHVNRIIGNILIVGEERITVGETYRPMAKELFKVI